MPVAARKEHRIHLRASEHDVNTISRAAAFAGVSVSAFILESASEPCRAYPGGPSAFRSFRRTVAGIHRGVGSAPPVIFPGWKNCCGSLPSLSELEPHSAPLSRVEPLARTHDVSSFDCGDHTSLSIWLKHFAWTNQQNEPHEPMSFTAPIAWLPIIRLQPEVRAGRCASARGKRTG